jgi:hypothetical protein
MELRRELNGMIGNTVVRKSKVCEGNELFARREMASGTIVGVSVGVVTNSGQWH